MAFPFEHSAASRHDATTDVIELICQEGFDGLSKAVEILINNALLIERDRHIGRRPV